MAFFPRALYDDDSSSFTPLFRLLDDFDTYTRQTGGGQPGPKRSGGGFWQPKFDVRETGDNYELHGELPGISKDNVHIEFTDSQTLVVRGRAERSYSAGTPPAGLIDQPDNKGAIEGGEASSHKATVEDETEGQGGSAAAEADKQQEQQEQQVEKVDKKKKQHHHRDHGVKYWLSERSVGEFSRTFTFPSPVDQDAVSASFRDGVLTIVVPKSKKQGSRRVAIN
ncbi:heat shock protein [Claviceps africana]|uniref:Heat shock protein n=1 Tax=Claviceps africana TaxID=83212 RepID=A0A8K0J8J8_9HYPO|nr:heat shock protein [Claviceps africana]